MSDLYVISVEFIACELPITVYDLSIPEDESFLLANGVIAHNSSICIARNGLKFAAEEPHDPIGHSIPYLSGCPYHPNCRSSMATVLDDGGPVTDQTVTQWLRNRDTAYQDEVLGPTRARMFREGKLSPRDLIAATSGRPLSLEEIGA